MTGDTGLIANQLIFSRSKGSTALLDAIYLALHEMKKSKMSKKALLVISAHWEEPVPTVMTAARPPMLYDYYGFPPEAYRITWPAAGDRKFQSGLSEQE